MLSSLVRKLASPMTVYKESPANIEITKISSKVSSMYLVLNHNKGAREQLGLLNYCFNSSNKKLERETTKKWNPLKGELTFKFNNGIHDFTPVLDPFGTRIHQNHTWKKINMNQEEKIREITRNTRDLTFMRCRNKHYTTIPWKSIDYSEKKAKETTVEEGRCQNWSMVADGLGNPP